LSKSLPDCFWGGVLYPDTFVVFVPGGGLRYIDMAKAGDFLGQSVADQLTGPVRICADYDAPFTGGAL
jgi:hypothetical protein